MSIALLMRIKQIADSGHTLLVREEASSKDDLMNRPGRNTIGTAIWIGLLVMQAVTLAQTDPAPIAKGKKVYEEKKCAACHAIKSTGGKVGPDLTVVGAMRDVQWLRQFMKDPKATDPKSKMMSFKGDDKELEALVAYLVSLK